jgi:hypothetical protein
MTFKKIASTCLALCLTATLAVAVSGCEDLGAFEDTEDYYDTFGSIRLINGVTGGSDTYSVEDYFYNESSREDYLVGEDGTYQGIEPAEYAYMAIPFHRDIRMDTLALYLQSQDDAAVYINVFVTDAVPSNWKSIAPDAANAENGENTDTDTGVDTGVDTGADAGADTENTENKYDDPDPATRIGEIVVHLQKGKWASFVLDDFLVQGQSQTSIDIKEDQYVLLQFRNNSGVREFDETKQAYVDPQTGLELPTARITMTNLLVRASDKSTNGIETQGGES